MSGSIPWKILESQYLSYEQESREEFEKLIHSPENLNAEEIIDAGRTFAKGFSNFNNILSELNMSLSSYLEKIFSSASRRNGVTSEKAIQIPESLEKQMTAEARKRETYLFMRGIMDECTHLANFSSPVDPELAIIINAKHDAYVPVSDVIPLTDIWQGSSVRYLNRGHVSAIIFDVRMEKHFDIFAF